MSNKGITSLVILLGVICFSLTKNERYSFYYIVVLLTALQVLMIVSSYVTAKRTGLYESSLINLNYPIKEGSLTVDILAQIILLVLLVIFFKRLDKSLLLFLVPVVLVSSVIQHRQLKDKKIPSYFIEGNYLFINVPFLKKYNLQELRSIKLNGFSEVYSAAFTGSKIVRLKKEYFDEAEFNSFLATMCKKSSHEVALSDNIAGEINAAKKYIAFNKL